MSNATPFTPSADANLEESDFTPRASFQFDSEEREPQRRFKPGETSDRDLDATRLYLNEIGFSPLLTAEEEVYYARRALRGDMAAQIGRAHV